VDVFYHFAWAGGFTSAIRDYKLQMKNAGAAGDAVMTAHAIGARKFVYANTYNKYEILNFLSSETFEPRYTCIYATGKTAASLICRTLAYNLGMEYSAGLVPMPYGERNYSKQLVNVVIHHLTEGNPPKLVEGNNLYDLVYIDDIADAFVMIGNCGRHMKEYYVGHRKLKTFREWMTEMRDCLAPDVELKFGEYKYDLEYTNLDGYVDTILRALVIVSEEVY
jgi:nucleoside-diphosphate-sugar epimerase